MKKSFFRNWHKPSQWFRTKQKELKFVMPRKDGKCLEITATAGDGTELTLHLDEELTKLFLLHLDRSWYGKIVTREMYGLPTL